MSLAHPPPRIPHACARSHLPEIAASALLSATVHEVAPSPLADPRNIAFGGPRRAQGPNPRGDADAAHGALGALGRGSGPTAVSTTLERRRKRALIYLAVATATREEPKQEGAQVRRQCSGSELVASPASARRPPRAASPSARPLPSSSSCLNSCRSIRFNTLATRALRLLVTLHSALPLFFGAFADVFFVRVGGSGEQGSRGKVACYVRLNLFVMKFFRNIFKDRDFGGCDIKVALNNHLWKQFKDAPK